MYDPKNSSYFQSLPVLTQESIMQSGMSFASEEELKQFVEQQEK